MRFNAAKCKVVHLGTKNVVLNYRIGDCVLDSREKKVGEIVSFIGPTSISERDKLSSIRRALLQVSNSEKYLRVIVTQHELPV